MTAAKLVFAATTVALLVVLCGGAASAQSPFFAIAGGGSTSDAQTSIIYNANTGELGVNAPVGKGLTSINIDSASAMFAGTPTNLGGDFDIFSPDTIFKATFGSSFGSLSFGLVAPVGLQQSFLLSDLTVDGSLATGGGLGDVDLVYIPVPEPSSLVLLGVGLAGLAVLGRRCRTR